VGLASALLGKVIEKGGIPKPLFETILDQLLQEQVWNGAGDFRV
jgi:hypothetical protein